MNELQVKLERILLSITAQEPLRCTRISSARAGSCPWPYWGVVRCQIRPTADGRRLKIHPLESARKEYRSTSRAFREVHERYPDRVFLGQGISRISQVDLARIIKEAAAVNPAYVDRHPELGEALASIGF